MSLRDHHELIRDLEQAWDAGNVERARDTLAEIAKLLFDASDMVSLRQAAELLGLHVATARILLKAEHVPVSSSTTDGELVPVGPVASLLHAPRTQQLRELDRLLERSSSLGSDSGMSEDQSDALDAGRSGTLPWKT